MRYKKGDIKITARDLALLYLMALARFITQNQLTYIHSQKRPAPAERANISKRLARYIRLGFVNRHRNAPDEDVLTLTPKGLAYLREKHALFAALTQGLKLYAPRFDSRFRDHELKINDIWVAFIKSGRLRRWITSHEINLIIRKGKRLTYKQYDAIATVEWSPGHACRIGIEYERIIKSSRNYEDARFTIAMDDEIPFVLYVCATDPMKTTLKRLFMKLQKVFFAQEKDILYDPMHAFVEQRRPDDTVFVGRLEDALMISRTSAENLSLDPAAH